MAIFELDGEAPDLPPGGRYWIADSAVVIGRVRLKTDASVWFNAVLRGDNEWIELGERSQIQDNAVLHTDPGFPLKIGENCVIGHNVVLHGCTIASNSLIGMGAVVLNGAMIGKNCLVGAGALVTLTGMSAAEAGIAMLNEQIAAVTSSSFFMAERSVCMRGHLTWPTRDGETECCCRWRRCWCR